MNIKLLVIGKTDADYIETATNLYFKRIKRYLNFEFKIIRDVKNAKNIEEKQQKELEGEKILNEISASDFLVLLDEKGKEFTSREFASYIEKQMLSSVKNLVFVIGGPYGFSNKIYERANSSISLSKMTFSHQLVRVIFAEQLYRAFSIINNEPYHHD